MAKTELENLVRLNVLKQEPREQRELEGLIAAGETALRDAEVSGISDQGRFLRAYAAAHSFSLAALRSHGYRPDNKRYAVFQALPHTLGIRPEIVRVLDKCHAQRNLAEYEGFFETDERLFAELLEAAHDLHKAVRKLGMLK
jgi:hypothetical protein